MRSITAEVLLNRTEKPSVSRKILSEVSLADKAAKESREKHMIAAAPKARKARRDTIVRRIHSNESLLKLWRKTSLLSLRVVFTLARKCGSCSSRCNFSVRSSTPGEPEARALARGTTNRRGMASEPNEELMCLANAGLYPAFGAFVAGVAGVIPQSAPQYGG